MLFITAYSPVSAKVVLRSLCGLVSVKKDSPSVGVSDSCQVLSSTVPAVVLSSTMPAWSPSVGILARGLLVQVAVRCERKASIAGISVQSFGWKVKAALLVLAWC